MTFPAGPSGAVAPVSMIRGDRDDRESGAETIEDEGGSPEDILFRGVEDHTHQRSRRDEPTDEDEEIVTLEDPEDDEDPEDEDDGEPGGYNREAAIDQILQREWQSQQQASQRQQPQGPLNYVGQPKAWHDQQMFNAGLNPQDPNDLERWGNFIRVQQAEEHARWANFRMDRMEQAYARETSLPKITAQFSSLGRDRAREAAEMVTDLEAAGLPRAKAIARVQKLTGGTAGKAKQAPRAAPPTPNAQNLRNAASVTGRGGARRQERGPAGGGGGPPDPTQSMADLERQMNQFRRTGRVPAGFGQARGGGKSRR